MGPFKTYAYIAAVLAVIALLGFTYYKGKSHEKTEAALESANTVMTIRKKQNEIRNHRPDTDALFERLHSGTF